jgi:hypothetical protein
VESNATIIPSIAVDECVLAASPGAAGLLLFTDSSIGNAPLLAMKKFPPFDVPPLAPGFVIVTVTSAVVASADPGTWISSVVNVGPPVAEIVVVILGVSESAPKFTVAPCATFSPDTVRIRGMASPAGAISGEKARSCGAPTTLLTAGVIVNATEFDICPAFATVMLTGPAIATSAPGTSTASAAQVAPAQLAEVTELGASAALPKFTWVPIPKPVPVTVKVKFPLPATTLVGETEAI